MDEVTKVGSPSSATDAIAEHPVASASIVAPNILARSGHDFQSALSKSPARSRPRQFTPLDATLQLRAFDLIKQSLEAHHALLDDAEVILAIAEGETSLLEALDCLLEADLNDEALLEGLRVLKETVLVRTHRLEERRKSRRVIVEQALLALERRVLERPCATISLNDRTAGVQIDDESLIPTRFFAMKPVLDRRALKAALENGEDVPGARLGAGLLTLTVRRR